MAFEVFSSFKNTIQLAGKSHAGISAAFGTFIAGQREMKKEAAAL